MSTSRLRVGPAARALTGVPSDAFGSATRTQTPPTGQFASTVQVVVGELLQILLGVGYGRKSGGAVGIGLVLYLFVLEVKPLKPVSSPVIVPLRTIDRSGSTSGPKVRCLVSLYPLGSIP